MTTVVGMTNRSIWLRLSTGLLLSGVSVSFAVMSFAAESNIEKEALINLICDETELDKKFAQQFKDTISIFVTNLKSSIRPSNSAADTAIGDFLTELPDTAMSQVGPRKFRQVIVDSMSVTYDANDLRSLLELYKNHALPPLTKIQSMIGEGQVEARKVIAPRVARAFELAVLEAEKDGVLPPGRQIKKSGGLPSSTRLASSLKAQQIQKLLGLLNADKLASSLLNEGLIGAVDQVNLVVWDRFGPDQNQTNMQKSDREKAFRLVLEKFQHNLQNDASLITEVKKSNECLLSEKLTLNEINQLIQFYQSPLGRKSVEQDSRLRLELAKKIQTEIVPEVKKAILQLAKKNMDKIAHSRTALANDGRHNKHNYRNLLLTPERNTMVSMADIKVKAASGSAVYIARNQKSIGIFNFHDRTTGGVKVLLNGHEITLWPGRVLLLAQNKDAKIENVWFLQKVGYGNSRHLALKNTIAAYEADFSIPQALKSIPALRPLIDSKEPRYQHLVDDIIKTAAVASVVRPKVRPLN